MSTLCLQMMKFSGVSLVIKAIIFDCFGVLATQGWIPFRDATFGHDAKMLQQANDTMRALSVGMLMPEEFMEQMAELSGKSVQELRPVFYTNIPNEPLLAWIRARKQTYAFGVLSNIASGRFEEIFSPEQRELFDDLALSGVLGFAKPDRRAYEHAMERLGHNAEECVFVDDQPKNVAAAEALGMSGIVYETQTQFEQEASEKQL